MFNINKYDCEISLYKIVKSGGKICNYTRRVVWTSPTAYGPP